MRWGIRRGNAAGAYSRGVKKLKKYNKRAEKLKAKSDKLSYKSGKIYAKGKNDEKTGIYERYGRGFADRPVVENALGRQCSIEPGAALRRRRP